MGNAIDALQADREALLDICAKLGDAEWKADSGCPGWSVQDVVAHLGALFWMLVDPSTLPAAADRPTEQAQEVYVRARRDWSAQRVVEDYRTVSSDAIGQLAELQTQDFELPLGDLGTYPASLLPNAYAFDHYTHIRADLFLPRGPLRTNPPASDELRLVPAIEWIAAALPQQNALVREALNGSGAAALQIVGPAGQVIEFGAGPNVATVTSDGPAFIRWITQRGSWEQLGVTATGDERALAALRRLHVY
jgi:uncharacterized protein (TIGR03083 family)